MLATIKDTYNGNPIPKNFDTIEFKDGKFIVPDRPVLTYVEGDGTGRDIWKASQRVFDAAVKKSSNGKREIGWYEVFAGEKSKAKFNEWLAPETVEAIKAFRVGIKGPLTTPVGGGIRSLNVGLRHLLNLYACVRPVKYIPGVPSPVKHPERMNVVIFRENTEDVYSGIEWASGTSEAAKVIEFLNTVSTKKIRPDSGVGIKPISPFGSKNLIRRAIKFALEHKKRVVTLVHKGNIMKFTEGAFRDWGYELTRDEFRQDCVIERESWILDNKDKNLNLTVEQNAAMVEPGLEFAPESFRQEVYAEVKSTLETIGSTHGKGQWKKKLMINDRIADSIFQQVVTRADEYDVLACPNLNGDYLSDACAAQVGGLGMAPGANIGDEYAFFEATHGTAPKYADLDVINPASVILSGCMMFDFIGWPEVSSMIENAIAKTVSQKKVTYDLHRMMEGATKLKTSEFASAIIENM
jgi:isocitrate dehydrogenase